MRPWLPQLRNAPPSHVRGRPAHDLLSPLALGSYWAVLVALPLIWVITARIHNEEEVRLRNLAGYTAYRDQVRYRLVPGLW
jgi:protein-S-isoprenylcysteine O-methyltransferase Ste14